MSDIKVIKASATLNNRNKSKNARLRVAAYCRVSTDDAALFVTNVWTKFA